MLTLNHRQVVALTKQRYDLFKDLFGDIPPSETAIQTELDMRAGVVRSPERLELWYGRAADTILKANGIKVDNTTRLFFLRKFTELMNKHYRTSSVTDEAITAQTP